MIYFYLYLIHFSRPNLKIFHQFIHFIKFILLMTKDHMNAIITPIFTSKSQYAHQIRKRRCFNIFS